MHWVGPPISHIPITIYHQKHLSIYLFFYCIFILVSFVFFVSLF